MHILITGGSGFIGQALSSQLLHQGHQVSLTSRHQPSAPIQTAAGQMPLNWIIWNGHEPLMLPSVDAIINLAGSPISRRWSPKVKRDILNSRIHTTRALVNSIAGGSLQPKVLISGSAAGYYGDTGSLVVTEDDRCWPNHPPQCDFLSQVCQSWEAEALLAEASSVRVILLRTGIVLGDGGFLNRLSPLFRAGLGGPIGGPPRSISPWLSWIHLVDLCRLISFILENPGLSGPINATAPFPLPLASFCRTLASTLRRPYWLPVPALLLRLLMGEQADVLLHGQQALPKKALDAGFEFHYPDAATALKALYSSSPDQEVL